MKEPRYPVGMQDFAFLREAGMVYVDKSEYVYRMANAGGTAYFLSRPRRFGKSLLVSTLKYYFQQSIVSARASASGNRTR